MLGRLSQRCSHITTRNPSASASFGLRGWCSSKSSSEEEDSNKGNAFPKTYDPTLFEGKWGELWDKRKGVVGKGKFRMILPPPNVTGKLHLGHALTLAVEDTIVRWKAMQGFDVEWIPGFDHAGIATHIVAMRKMKGGEKDTGTIQEMAEENLESIKQQLKWMGVLLNWDKAYYTLDEKHSEVVKEAFVHLYEAGLIGRLDGIVNWSCALQSSVSDIEVDHIDFNGRISVNVPGYSNPIEFGLLYYCAYRLEHSEESLVVATSRPETMFGDVALAINTMDSRHAHFIGKFVINPLTQKLIPVIGDSRVKTNFGTGVVKITPAHDKLDFAIGSTHKLPTINVITNDGLLQADGFIGAVPRFDARPKVLNFLESVGALRKVEAYSGGIDICSRTGDVIEPKLMPHWFFKTKKLTEQLVDEINSQKIIISPQSHCVDLLHQLSKCQDWCLSRQIKWGHRIPMYHHKKHAEKWVSALNLKEAKHKLESQLDISIPIDSEIVQDSDVLDTWFSSSLIPVALSGWPDTKKIDEISLMETGHDILLFWVWRMMITTLALTGKFPFKHILLHGIVVDKYGRKMSKSKGNVIDPMHIVNGITHAELYNQTRAALDSGELEKNEFDLKLAAINSDYPQGFQSFGRDALRFALLSQNIQAQQISLDISYLENCRHFTNKLWQAVRFFYVYCKQMEEYGSWKMLKTLNIKSVADRWILACLYDFAAEAEKYLDAGQFHLYAEVVRRFFYQKLCDIYIELVKNDLKTGNDARQHLLVLRFVIETGLKLSHPLLPFVTEEIWSHLNYESLILEEQYPKSAELKIFENQTLNTVVAKAMKIVKEIRSLKVRTGIKLKTNPKMYVEVPATELPDIGTMKANIERLAGCELICDSPPAVEKDNFITVIAQIDGLICRISTHKALGTSTAKYLEGERNKISKLQLRLAKLKQQYENPNFQQYASSEVKEKLKKKLETLETQINEVISTGPTQDSHTP